MAFVAEARATDAEEQLRCAPKCRFNCFLAGRKYGVQKRSVHNVMLQADCTLRPRGSHTLNPSACARALNPFHMQPVGEHMPVARC